MTEELKPCPFCGCSDVRLKHDNGVSFVYCYECFSRGSDFDNRSTVYRGGDAPFRAIEAWNKRVPEANEPLDIYNCDNDMMDK